MWVYDDYDRMIRRPRPSEPGVPFQVARYRALVHAAEMEVQARLLRELVEGLLQEQFEEMFPEMFPAGGGQ